MPVNPVIAGGAAVAVSVAVAAAIVMYESPELRRYADDIRHRIAMAFQSLGDSFNQQQQQHSPRFNRPEDADGFLQSSAEPGVDADDETKRRQREELMYWNSVLLKKKEEEAAKNKKEGSTSFDDFLSRDNSADGAYVFNTGAQAHAADGLRQRHAQYTNPFADEYGIASDELPPPVPPKQRETTMSDIYSATTRDYEDVVAPFSPDTLGRGSPLVDVSGIPLPPTLERRLAEDEFVSAGQDDRRDAYASIQAWANDSSRNFYSPLPETPVAPVSEPEVVSEGQLTPTDSVSVIGSGEAVSNDDDVISESDGILTPASWSEVGSVVSDEHHYPVHA